MAIPTKPIGSIPRLRGLMEAIAARGDGTDTALAKIRAPVLGTALACRTVGGEA